MRAWTDIAVYDENGQLSALVEVRAVPETSAQWAAQIRREMIEASGMTPRYCVVVARDSAYVWTSPATPDAVADQTFKTDDLFQHYFDYIKSDSRSITADGLELIVSFWLTDLTLRADYTADVTALEESGLLSAVANGRIEYLEAA